MPQYTGGRVLFGRTMQPVQYESKRAELEVAFTMDEGETIEQAAKDALDFCEDTVLSRLGLNRARTTGADVEEPRPVRRRVDTR